MFYKEQISSAAPAPKSHLLFLRHPLRRCWSSAGAPGAALGASPQHQPLGQDPKMIFASFQGGFGCLLPAGCHTRAEGHSVGVTKPAPSLGGDTSALLSQKPAPCDIEGPVCSFLLLFGFIFIFYFIWVSFILQLSAFIWVHLSIFLLLFLFLFGFHLFCSSLLLFGFICAAFCFYVSCVLYCSFLL